jgi:hypothetical protein
VQQADDNGVWDDHPDLLFWLLYMGGAFVPKGSTRSNYVVLLSQMHVSKFGNLYSSWPEVHEVLERFIWSEKAFVQQVKEFWEESSSQNSSTL